MPRANPSYCPHCLCMAPVKTVETRKLDADVWRRRYCEAGEHFFITCERPAEDATMPGGTGSFSSGLKFTGSVAVKPGGRASFAATSDLGAALAAAWR